jgi:hypothetical protein
MNSISSRFRRSIVKRDKNCIISRVSHIESDACHIIPRWVCEKLIPEEKFNPNNGILMSKNIHKLFDNYFWTFDIERVKLKNQKISKFRVKINKALCDKEKYTINKYNKKYVKISKSLYPFLYVHFKIYSILSNTPDKVIKLEDYAQIIYSDEFKNFTKE